MQTSHDRARRWLLLALALVIPAALLAGDFVGELGAWVVLAAAAVAGSMWVPRFWSTLTAGAFAGGLAGLAVLGPALRLAMRVVAAIDPVRATEFTVGGTIFLLMFGSIVGAAIGISLGFIRRAVGAATLHAGLGIALVGLGILLVDSETRVELFDLGAGWGMNIPMFGLVFGLFGGATEWLLESFDRRRATNGAAKVLDPSLAV